jgi:hypothetical protein
MELAAASYSETHVTSSADTSGALTMPFVAVVVAEEQLVGSLESSVRDIDDDDEVVVVAWCVIGALYWIPATVMMEDYNDY